MRPGNDWRRWRAFFVAIILTQVCANIALAQDRPLLEPLRIGYPHDDPVGAQLSRTASLEIALRRKGYIPDWLSFAEGLDVVRSLDAGELDLALNIPLGDVVAAKRASLKMVFIAELRSIAPTCCELEQQFSDHILKRYTLSSEYLADSREDVLLILHRETVRVLRQPTQPPASESTGPTSVALKKRQPVSRSLTSPMTRNTMQDANETARRSLATNSVDLSDANYWAPSE